ncbi:glycosyl transferase, group 2 family protein [Chondrocystis sp. NIES-4102]|nr:glycosyl transferase, group 2 family protein [Chondrocystis sp. NIES-4102]
MEKYLVSVIIPTYNRADLIPRAIASVIGQVYQNWEIIVVDDASDQDIAQVIKSINDSRITYIRHQTNLGGSAARNTGIKYAQGEYIAFLDSDDLWLPDKLSLQLAAIAQQESQDNLVCYSQFQKSQQVFYQPAVLPRRGKQQQESIADYFWLSGGEMLTSTLLVSRDLAAATLFQAQLPKHQDLDFSLRLAQQGARFIFVPQVLVIWHNESRSDRISLIANPEFSLDWIEQYRPTISQGAWLGFVVKEVVPKMIKNSDNQAQVIKLIFQAWHKQVISPIYGLYLLIKLALPDHYLQLIKKIIKPRVISG